MSERSYHGATSRYIIFNVHPDKGLGKLMKKSYVSIYTFKFRTRPRVGTASGIVSDSRRQRDHAEKHTSRVL